MSVFKSKLIDFTLTLSVLIVMLLFWLQTRRVSGAATPCGNNLFIIELCKHDWASVNSKTGKDVPTMDDLRPELKSYAIQYNWTNGVPVCPDGGTYIIESVDERPQCSIGGPRHSLP